MAAIAFNNALHAAARLEAALSAVGERIDAFVSYRMRLAAAEAGLPAQRKRGQVVTIDMPDRPAAAIERGRERPGLAPDDLAASIVTQFRSLEPGILSEAIPVFFIGRNKQGFWVARDAKGKIGGIFLFENSARSFAKSNSRGSGCATILQPEPFELDLENSGNPIVGYIVRLKRLLNHAQRRTVPPSTGR